MRLAFLRTVPVLVLLSGCASTLYSHYAGPVATPADQAYTCVQEQLKALGYIRKQYDKDQRWWMATKTLKEGNSSGLYKETLEVLDTRVKGGPTGPATLDIIARTYEVYATARGDDQQERKASDRVQIDARTLGQACAK